MASSKSGILADRMKHLLDTAKLADAHFLVGDGDGKELLSAHKGILVSASDVFEAMFRFDSQNGQAENVEKNAGAQPCRPKRDGPTVPAQPCRPKRDGPTVPAQT
ncbi:hypothetical protein niasHT_028783 [Heterodera trifolii]|uniref:BTB domain-containing protein n=1 Tax=Heterodera trifolii TaxID=157864 RepID=A0ABD2KQE1_9BILA